MSKDWYSAKGLAGQPGMPGTVQAVNARAKNEGWESRRRTGRGGGREYALTSLPAETKLALLGQLVHPAGKVKPARKTRRPALARRDMATLSASLREVAKDQARVAMQLEVLAEALAAAAEESGDE